MSKKQRGRPPKAEDEKLRGYRYNLNLDKDLNEYLHDIAWQNRTSITQYINDLIRKDMEEKENKMSDKKAGRPIERPDTYRFSLYLDGDLEPFIKHRSWLKRKSVTQYMNDLVRADMNMFIANGGRIPEETPKKMTLTEIEKVVGCPVEIVGEQEDKA